MKDTRVLCTSLTHKSLVCKTYLTVSDSQDKAKDTVVVFEDCFHNHFDDPGTVNDIWSDGPSSE